MDLRLAIVAVLHSHNTNVAVAKWTAPYNDYNTRRQPSVASPILDFSTLRLACNKMCRFTYHMISQDTHALAVFAKMFPYLNRLQVIFNGNRQYQWVVWTASQFLYCLQRQLLSSFQDECLVSLSLYHDLMYLTLGLDFELVEDNLLKSDHNLAWYWHCFLWWFEATKLIVKVWNDVDGCSRAKTVRETINFLSSYWTRMPGKDVELWGLSKNGGWLTIINPVTGEIC